MGAQRGGLAVVSGGLVRALDGLAGAERERPVQALGGLAVGWGPRLVRALVRALVQALV